MEEVTLPAVALWLAAEEATSGFDPGVLAQYGVLGVFATILLIFAKTAYARETARADRLEAEVGRLNAMIVDRVIPLLSTATNSLEDATELLRDSQREREAFLLRERAGDHRYARGLPRPEGDRT